MTLQKLPVPLLFAAILFSSAVCAGSSVPSKPFLPLDKVEKGMVCTSYSCFSDTDLETLTVEIIGVIDNGTPTNSVIIGKADSPSVRRGGIMSGMSGSPVYHDGRLLGAISTAYPYATEPICGITPVEAMTRLWELETAPGRDDSRKPRRDLIPFPDIYPEDSTGLRPIGLSLGVRGMQRRDLAGLDIFHGITAIETGGVSTDNAPVELQPGSPVGVGLITGDLQLVAFGTVTHVNGNRILAFGHGSFGLGKCALPLIASSVVSFIPNQIVSFKLANAGNPIGTLTFDAPSGVAGVLGQTAPTIPVEISIAGLSPRPETYRIQAADHEFLSSTFIAQAVAGAIHRLGAPWGDVSMTSDLSIRIKDVGTVHQQEMIGSIDNIWPTVRETFQLLEKIHQNPLKPVSIEHVDYRCTLVQESRIMTLDSLGLRDREYRSGDTLDIRLSFHGDRIDALDETISLEIPGTLPSGRYVIHVLDAADYNRLKALQYPPPHRHPSLQSYVSSLEDHLAGNQIMAILTDAGTDLRSGERILPSVPPLLEHVLGSAGSGVQRTPSIRFLTETMKTLDYQVFGSHKIPVTIGASMESD